VFCFAAGKTLLEVLQGLRWLREGLDVHVVCTDYVKMVASYLIYSQLNNTLTKDAATSPEGGTTTAPKGKVHFHVYNFDNMGMPEVKRAVEELSAKAKDGNLCVLLDEARFSTG
jgi:hypothetical protein